MASVSLQEKANFTRLSRLLVDKGTEALRITLDAIHPRANLPAVLNANRATLLKLKPRVINGTQWDLLFPPTGNPPDSRTFDVTLLTILLRNLSGLPPPATGWNAMPPDADNSLQASITRIKMFRNQVYGHVASTEVDKTTFDHLWLKISKALVDLKIPPNEIDDLKTCPIGPEEEIYGQSFKEWFLKEEECKDLLDALTRNVNLMHNQLKEDRENVKKLREIMEQSHQGIQQLCTSSASKSELPKSTSDSEEGKSGDKHNATGDEQLLQKLAKHNFKSKIKRKVKFFHPGTREWLLEQVYSWFELEDESRLLLVTAGPGFGKSVFAAKVCEIFEGKGKLAACHFCDFSNSNLKDPMRMLQSLASHMSQNIVGFKEKLLDQLKRPHEVRSLKDAFQIYMQNPLDELEVGTSLIVIDGLDESATDDKSDMVKLIADNFPDLPECVKVLVTSRPELSVREMDDVERIEIDVEDVDNESDILNYLNVCLPSLAARDAMNRLTQHESTREVLPKVVEKCEGSFLYAFHVQRELNKREDLDTMTFEEIMSFLPEGMGSVYHDYFHRLEIELEVVMKTKPDLFKILEILVAFDTRTESTDLPLRFIARTLDLGLDCRETKKIINKVNDAVSCLLYVSDDMIAVFHKSVYDWLVADGYDGHEYTVKVCDGKKRLWLLCEQVLKEIKNVVCSEQVLKLTNEVRHSLECGYEYLLACDMKNSFSWFADIIIVHLFLTVHPRSTLRLHGILERVNLQCDPAPKIQLQHRISWHVAEFGYLANHEVFATSKFKSTQPMSYLENVLEYSPEGCFTDDDRKIAELILAKSARSVKRISPGMKSLNPLATKLFSSTIVAVGVSSSKKLAAVGLENGTICVLKLPELIELWQCSTENNSISCCTFSLDDEYVLYGKLETVIDIRQRKEVMFFHGEVEVFKSCAFSPNGKRLLTNDGSCTVKLWDVVRRSLVAVLSAEAPVDSCTFTKTGLFIVGCVTFTKGDTYCVWNSITLQRVDQRARFFGGRRRNIDGVLRSERCDRCLRQECKELIPSRAGLRTMPFMRLGRHLSHLVPLILNPKTLQNKISPGIYKKVDCIFYLYKQESLRIIETIHFTTLAAWEIFMGSYTILLQDSPFIDIAAIEDDYWLYVCDERLFVFSSVSSEEYQPSLIRPTFVLWCSFSPDGTRLATCTSDGFINLWNVSTSQVYQRFQSGCETSLAACWWTNKYLYVCHVTDKIPSLSRYPVNGSLKVIINERQSLPLCAKKQAFSQFSGFVDFSEGYLSFECGKTEPVKVLDVRKTGHPKKIILPGIKPMMSIAVSYRASFVLAAGNECFLWKKNKSQPTVYYVFAKFGLTMASACCFSTDSKFALVSSLLMFGRNFVVIDLNTGSRILDEFQDIETSSSSHGVIKPFCTDTAVILLTPNLIEIHDLETWKRLAVSFQRHLANDFLIHSKLSPKGTVLAVPRLTGDMEFLRLCIPKSSSVVASQKTMDLSDRFDNISNVKKNVETSSGPVRSGNVPKTKNDVKETLPDLGNFGSISTGRKNVRETLPGPGGFGNTPKAETDVKEASPVPSKFESIPTVRKKIKDTLLVPGRVGKTTKIEKSGKESLPGPGKFGYTPKAKSGAKETLPLSGKFENIPTIERKVKETLPGPGRFGEIPKIKKNVKDILPAPGRFGNIPKAKSDIKKTLPVPGKSENIPTIERKVKETLPGPGRFGEIPKIKKNVKDILPGPGRFGNIPKAKSDIKKTLPVPGKFENIPTIERKVKETLPGPGRFGKIPKIKKNVKDILPGPGRFGNIPKAKSDIKKTLPVPGKSENIPTIERKVKETLPGPGRFGKIPKIKKNVKDILPGPGRFANIPKAKSDIKKTLPVPGKSENIPTIETTLLGPGRFGNVPKIKKKFKNTL